MLKILIIFAIVLAILVALIAIFLPNIERTLVYWPNRTVHQTPDEFGVGYDLLEIESTDGTKLVAWTIPYVRDGASLELDNDERDSNQSLLVKPWLIYFHGNASNISYHLAYTTRLAQKLQVNLLLAEYRGFFKSEGKAGEKGIAQDARSYYDYLIGQGVAAEDIILYGYSLGSGVATELANKVDVAALILEAPYTSVPNAAKAAYGPWLPVALIRNRFENIKKIASIDAPLFITHGQQDRTIPFFMGEQLFVEAVEPKVFRAFQGDHTTLVEGNYPEITLEMQQFLEQNGALPK